MARDAYPYLMTLVLVALGCFYFELQIPGVVLLALAGFIAFFFRDPDRVIPPDEAAVVSPADGKVVGLARLDPADPASATRLSIFLSVFDVHINRAPIAGQVKDVAYHPGKFKAAFKDEASVVNEQSVVTIEGRGVDLVFKQIAGVLARRIVFTKRRGDWVAKGERVGLIKFGSRVDVILPQGVEVSVKVGEQVYGGSSMIGRIRL
jgi:phosphatidylserine decarboxylase